VAVCVGTGGLGSAAGPDGYAIPGYCGRSCSGVLDGSGAADDPVPRSSASERLCALTGTVAGLLVTAPSAAKSTNTAPAVAQTCQGLARSQRSHCSSWTRSGLRTGFPRETVCDRNAADNRGSGAGAVAADQDSQATAS